MKTTCLILLAISLATGCRTSTIRSNDVGRQVVIIGELGHRVGATVEVDGEIVWKSVPPDAKELFITAVNGKTLPSPTTMDAEPLPDLPAGSKVRLRGHERCTVLWQTAGMTNLGPDAEKTYVPHQRMDSTFVVDRVLEGDMNRK